MSKLIGKLRNKKGFTLVELVIIIAILGTITSIAVPRFKNIQLDSEWTADVATAAMIGKAAELYVVKERPATPDTIELSDLKDYLADTKPKPQFTGFTDLGDNDLEFVLEISELGAAKVSYTDGTNEIELYPNPEDMDKTITSN